MFGWFKPIKTVEDLVRRKRTYGEVCWWIENSIEYRPDTSPFWPTSEEVLRDREANCKGFAVLTYDALKRMGYDPHIISLMWEGQDGKLNHSIVCVEIASVWYSVSLGVLDRHDKAATLLDAVKSFESGVLYAQEVNTKGEHLMTLISKI